MFYSVRHVTRYRYDAPVRESVMQLYVQPKSEGAQRLQSFQVATSPRAGLQAYTDHFGNAVYHFDVPGSHQELTVEADAEVDASDAGRTQWVDASAWSALETPQTKGEHFDMLHERGLAHATPALTAFLAERGLSRTSDPMTSLRRLTRTLFDAFAYAPEATGSGLRPSTSRWPSARVCARTSRIS